jgi:hypothetical protein
VITSSAIQRSRSVMFGWLRTRSSRTSWMALPVASAAVRDAAHRMPAFAREVQAQRSLGVGRERHAASTSHATARALCSAMKRARVLVHEAGAGILGVAHVRFDAVIVASTPTMPP